jgi:hypothetical protein
MAPGSNPKKKAAAFFIACLLVLLKSAAAGAAAPPASEAAGKPDLPGLWRKALDVFQRNSDWLPGKVSILSEMLDRQGRPDSITKLDFNIVLDGKGEARTVLLQAFKDGEDVSAEMKKKLATDETQDSKAAGKKSTLTVSLAESPFNPGRQPDVTVRANAEKQLLFGRLCQRFDFSFKTEMAGNGKKAEKTTWVGKAWLEENSGIPLKLEFSLEPLPKHVNSLWTIYLYETNAAGDWMLREIEIQGQGGFLFIRKSFRSTTSFGEYQRQPQKGDER